MKYPFFLMTFLFLVSACTNKDEKVYPKIMPLTESVYASATVQPDSLYQVYSVVTGILDKVWVEEGDTVSKDERILHVTNTSPELSMKNAELALQLARENYSGSAAILKGIEDEIQSAQLTLKNDSINYFRQRNLWNQNIGSKVEFDNRKLAYELSQNKLNLLKRNYLRTENELQTQLKQAENNYKTTMTVNKDFTITSKINGKVYAIYKDPGEIVNQLEPVAAIGRTDSFVIELLVDEVDIVKLRIGQKVLITLDAYNSEVFQATLNKIYPRKDERSQTFKVEAIFKTPPYTLYPGLSGEGNIIIAQKEETLTIPKEYLIDGTKVLTENGEQPVSVGLQNLDRIEILEGIDKNTALLKPEE